MNSPILRALCYKYYRREKNLQQDGTVVWDIKHRFSDDLSKLIDKKPELNYPIKVHSEYKDTQILRLVNGLLLLYAFTDDFRYWKTKNLAHHSLLRTYGKIESYGGTLVEEFSYDILRKMLQRKFEIVHTNSTLKGIDFILYNQQGDYWKTGFQVKAMCICERKTGKSYHLKDRLFWNQLRSKGRKIKRNYPNKRLLLLIPEVHTYGKKGPNFFSQLEQAWDGILYFWKWDWNENYHIIEMHGFKKLLETQ